MSHTDGISNLTDDRVFESDHENGSTSSGRNGDVTGVVNGDVTTRLPAISSRNTRIVGLRIAQKPKTQKPPDAVTEPPRRRQNVTGKLVPKHNGKARNMTAWPKPDKRLAGGTGGNAENPLGVAKTGPNGTADESAVTDFKARYPVDMWKDHGFYTDDYMELINSHWFTFTPPNPASHYILGVLYTVIMVFGCFGNSLVIFMYIK